MSQQSGEKAVYNAVVDALQDITIEEYGPAVQYDDLVTVGELDGRAEKRFKDAIGTLSKNGLIEEWSKTTNKVLIGYSDENNVWHEYSDGHWEGVRSHVDDLLEREI